MTDIAAVKEQLKKFIVETSFVPAEKVKDDTLIFVEGIFDSMGFLSLINFIEDNFKIKAADSELLEGNFESVNAISGFISRKLN
ncbi:MAG: acyl carrier protein [Bacteroidetes bacterium]|jgi:acyl carrier protein|nr:MAG: acyl carrier protein [Bacteroidota bacterium]MBK6344437.1 acyl carrier protein [Bacteroidales bacterium]MBK9357942.1 acyl carrier protein [Bacteroidales bacterium]